MKAWLFALLAFAALACSCEHFKNEPWNGKLYVGDSTKASVVRSQDDEEIKATDPQFGGMICMSAPDFRDLLDKYRGYRANCPAPLDVPGPTPEPIPSNPVTPPPAAVPEPGPPVKPEHAEATPTEEHAQ